MTVATLRLELRIENCQTGREKRRRMRAIVTRLHQHFNVSVVEDERGDDPSVALLVAVAVGRTRREARETIERVAEAVAAYPRAAILGQAITEI